MGFKVLEAIEELNSKGYDVLFVEYNGKRWIECNGNISIEKEVRKVYGTYIEESYIYPLQEIMVEVGLNEETTTAAKAAVK